MARTRLSRHELKETDEITSFFQTYTEAAVARKKEIGIAVAAVLGLAVILVGWRWYSANQNTQAQSLLASAISAYSDPNIKSEKERFEKTLTAAQKTHDAYPSITAGRIAQYYMALSQDGLGDTAKATENLQQVISSGDPDLAGVAKFALAGIHKKRGESQKALDLYKQLYDGGGYPKSAVVFEMAKVSEAANKTDDAKTYYQKIVTEFPESPFRQEADDALKRLGAPAPEQKPS